MQSVSNNIRIRRDYSKIKSAEIIPDLIEMQKKSYEKFLQIGLKKEQREDIGLSSIFSLFFPMSSNDGRFILEFIDYSFDELRYDIDECKKRGSNYALPLRMKLRLTTNEIDKDTGAISPKDVKEQDVYLCDIPIMTDDGTFVINGTERVIVSQIYRSPGVFFDHDGGKSANGKLLYGASVIPYLGSWLDIEFDGKDLIYIRIDKRKKIPLNCLLRSLDNKKTEKLRAKVAKEGKILDSALVEGMSTEEILETFYQKVSVKRVQNNVYEMPFVADFYKGKKLDFDLVDATTKEVLIAADTIITIGVLKKLGKKLEALVAVPEKELYGRYIAADIKNSDGEVLFAAGLEINQEMLATLHSNKIAKFDILLIDNINIGPYVLNSVLSDKNVDRFAALNEIYKNVKASEAPNLEVAEELWYNLFFNNARYDLSEVGRVKISEKFGSTNEDRVLTKGDIINVIKTLLNIREGKDTVDDIDHLGNRRVRSVGELIENELRVAFVRMGRFAQEKMATADELLPNEVLNVKSIQATIREFFGTSQLSQFMDQTNPLSEITHKRRLSALGPKGLARERASFEVRDVHLTHYGRICPIETPEGPNIGLINSLAVYARINRLGFLETPYRKVTNGMVSDEIVYMNATQEGKYVIAQATVAMKGNKIVDDLVSCRIKGELTLCAPLDVEYMDVSPKQLVSVAASLVPFLENDDANRALMGANMQRQAVPLIKSEAPIVGTGMERIVARDSGVAIVARNSGVIHYVDANKIVVKITDKVNGTVNGMDVYPIKKFLRSNHNTCINQKPIVKLGEFVNAGDIIADGHSIDKGELALGKNVLVAFMPWNGYNFEDSILISEKVVTDDVFTSVHIEEFEVVARDTKLGAEEITADIPNIGEDALKNLDESGIVYVGAEVKSGDILVGKVTPKAESVMTSEEKLLRAIFGEKASDVKDTSLRLPSGISGTVIGVRVFSRRGTEKDSRTQSMERALLDSFNNERDEQYEILEDDYLLKTSDLLLSKELVSKKASENGKALTNKDLQALSLSDRFKLVVKDKAVMATLATMNKDFEVEVSKLNKIFEDKQAILQKGDDLPSGVLKMVKLFVAVKRKLQPGDKMAGRHGNKGVVSRILPVEDMPYLEDGTPVDICLNPLGVPSRMNVGQILEVHLGWASANIGKQITAMLDVFYKDKKNIPDIRNYLLKCYGSAHEAAIKALSDEELVVLAKNIKKGMPITTPVFDGVKEKDIDEMLALSNLDTSGQVVLYDGRTGEAFERKITVGYMYMLKLHHLVDDKIHARSIGPYSLITQQPLGGKAQFGGQRFGEMEVWALEAYGAAYILQEMLTVKSDDQTGRTQVYESIIKGDETFTTGIPESFNVLIKELRSLCLNLEMQKNEE